MRPRASSLTVLNLFVAVVVSAMESQVMAEARAEEAEHAADEQTTNWMILEEIKVLRAELAEMLLERAKPESAPPLATSSSMLTTLRVPR